MKVRIFQLVLVSVSVGTGLCLLSGNVLADGGQAVTSADQSSSVVLVTSTTTTNDSASIVTKSDPGTNAVTTKTAHTALISGSSSSSLPQATGSQLAAPLTAETATSAPKSIPDASAQVASTSVLTADQAALANLPVASTNPIASSATRSQLARLSWLDANTTGGLPTYADSLGYPSGANPGTSSNVPQAPHKAPVRSSGALGSLGQMLATTTVPSARLLKFSNIASGALPDLLLLALTLSGGLFVFLFLRRQGGTFLDMLNRMNFSHGARSDCSSFSFFFATPRFESLYLVEPPGSRLPF